MAIVTTALNVSSYTANTESLYSWLKDNATEYFDNVTMNEDEITCEVGGTSKLVICPSNPSKSNITITNNVTCKFGGNQTSSIPLYKKAIKTYKGIRLVTANSNNIGDVFIVKSNVGSTSVVAHQVFSANNTYFADLVFDLSIINISQIPNHIFSSELTTLTPVVFGDAGTYADGLYITTFTQYKNTNGIVTLNDKKYSYNGCIALEE